MKEASMRKRRLVLHITCLCGLATLNPGCGDHSPDPSAEVKFDPLDDSDIELGGMIFSQSPIKFGDIGFSVGKEFNSFSSVCGTRFLDATFDTVEHEAPIKNKAFTFVKQKSVKSNFDGVYSATITAKADLDIMQNIQFDVSLSPKTRDRKPTTTNLFEECLTWNESVRGLPHPDLKILRDAYAIETGTATIAVRRLEAYDGHLEGGQKAVTYGDLKYKQESTTETTVQVYFARWTRLPPVRPLVETDIIVTSQKYMVSAPIGKQIGTLHYSVPRAHYGLTLDFAETGGLYALLTDGKSTAADHLSLKCDGPPCSGDLQVIQKGSPGAVESLQFHFEATDEFGTDVQSKADVTLIGCAPPPP